MEGREGGREGRREGGREGGKERLECCYVRLFVGLIVKTAKACPSVL